MNFKLYFEVLFGRFIIAFIGFFVVLNSHGEDSPVFYIYNIDDDQIQQLIDNQTYKQAKDYKLLLKYLNQKQELNQFDYNSNLVNLTADDIKDYKFEAININSKSSGAPTCAC